MGSDTPFTYYLIVDHVHDGDSIMGALDMGLAHYLGRVGGPTYTIRLYGINAPEVNSRDPAIREAAQAATANLASLVKPGDYIKIVSYHFDKYSGRIDAVPFSVSGVDCCQAQLEGGFAVPYSP